MNSKFQCTPGADYTFTIEATCDPDASTATAFFKAKSLEDECNPVVELVSQHACPLFSVHALWRYFEKYSLAIALLLIIGGSFLLAQGQRFYKATVAVATMLLVGFASLLAVYVLIMPAGSPEWTVWISIFVTFGFGLGVGWIAAESIRFGILIIGVLLGSFLGIVVFNLLVYRLSTDNPLLGLWLTIMLFSVPVAIISFKHHELSLIHI